MTSVLIEQQLAGLGSEESTVLRRRCEQFGRLGFDPVDSRLLAESKADLGHARSLSAADCPLDVAYRILT